MSQGHGGLDPRITGPASLAQARASKTRPGIPLISDEEALRRQQAADDSRRRRRLLVRIGAAVVAVVIAILALLFITPG